MYLSLALYANACAFELGEPLSLLSSGYRASIFQWWYLHENDKEVHCLQLLSLHHAPSGSSPVNARRGPGHWAPLALCQEPWEEDPCRTSRQCKSSLLPCVHHLWVTNHPSLLVNCLPLHPLPVISLTSVTNHPSLASTYVHWTNLVNWCCSLPWSIKRWLIILMLFIIFTVVLCRLAIVQKH